MSKYLVTGMITISVSTEVVAKTKEDALRKANMRGMMSLCHQCARGQRDQEFCTSGELDGEPFDLEVEEID